MPPHIKFQKQEIVNAALKIASRQGIDAVTAREVAKELQVSVGPIFTWYDSMDALRRDVYEQAKGCYRSFIEQGLKEEIPFLGIWRQFLLFARREPEIYRLLFLTPPGKDLGGAVEMLEFSRGLARESVMRIYGMDEKTADSFFRDIWLVAFSYATLIVTDDCPYTDEEMLAVGRRISLSVCMAYKEIPGILEGMYDADAIFKSLTGTGEQ